MESKKTFGEYIRERRKELGMTQKEFAEKLYVTESAVSKWERGMSYPDITLLLDICAALDVTEHELLTASVDTQKRSAEREAAFAEFRRAAGDDLRGIGIVEAGRRVVAEPHPLVVVREVGCRVGPSRGGAVDGCGDRFGVEEGTGEIARDAEFQGREARAEFVGEAGTEGQHLFVEADRAVEGDDAEFGAEFHRPIADNGMGWRCVGPPLRRRRGRRGSSRCPTWRRSALPRRAAPP